MDIQEEERLLQEKLAKNEVVRKNHQKRNIDAAQQELKFQQALQELGLQGGIQNINCDEMIAIVQRQHEVAGEMEHRKHNLTTHIARLERHIATAKQQLQVWT